MCVPRNDEQDKTLHVQVQTTKTFQSPAASLFLLLCLSQSLRLSVASSVSSVSLSLSLLLFLSGFVIFLNHLCLDPSLPLASSSLVRSFLISAPVRGPPVIPVRGPSSPLFGVLPDPCSGSFYHPCAGRSRTVQARGDLWERGFASGPARSEHQKTLGM